MGTDIHHLRDQPVPILHSAFRRLPPDVFASDWEQVHETILHGKGEAS
jgi:hypothetical protein